MIKSIVLVTLSFVLISSILAPSMVLLSDDKIELLGLEDFSEEETNQGEKEIFEKEVILHAYHKHELLLMRLRSTLTQFYQDYTFMQHSDIFLPPPKQIS